MTKRIDTRLKVILLGGSSNVGKSTIGNMLASRLGWRCVSTDSLAKHPGRPWPKRKAKVPDDVSQHYLNLKADELLESVILHHRRMSPLVAEFIWSILRGASDDRTVLEGSALWPFIAAGHRLKELGAVWLTASPETLRARIHESSGYQNADARSRAMISSFLERTILFDQKTTQLVREHGCKILDTDQFETADDIVGEIINQFGAQGRR